MVESIKELNKLCQKPHYKEVGNWMVRHILRDAALPVTWLLLHTSITANQVTLVSLIVALIGIFLMALPSTQMFVAGTFLLQLWYLLDHVDGQIARYRKTACLSGRFFDFIMHHLIHGALFFALGVYYFYMTSQFFYIILAYIASLSAILFNLTHDAKYKTFFEQFSLARVITMKDNPASQKKKKGSILKQIYSVLHKLIEIHVFMNILTASAVAQMFFTRLDFRFWLFWFYFGASVSLGITKITFLILKRVIDKEFSENFEITNKV